MFQGQEDIVIILILQAALQLALWEAAAAHQLVQQAALAELVSATLNVAQEIQGLALTAALIHALLVVQNSALVEPKAVSLIAHGAHALEQAALASLVLAEFLFVKKKQTPGLVGVHAVLAISALVMMETAWQMVYGKMLTTMA
ncbi:MAG: hypothetical protein QXE05_00955 [Nitrososphaeria archaeon]